MKLFISEEHCIVFVTKGGFMSEGTGRFLLLPKNIPNLYPKQKI